MKMTLQKKDIDTVFIKDALDNFTSSVQTIRYIQKQNVGRMSRTPAPKKTMAEPQTPEAELEDSVPIRLTQAQWMDMLSIEETEETVVVIIEQLFRRVMDGCLKVDVKHQMAPYTANWVKNLLIQIVEQHFLCRDEGDGPDVVPTEDSEPPPAEPDAWAQGCVPLVTPAPPLRPISPKDTDAVKKEMEEQTLSECSTMFPSDSSLKLSTIRKTSPKPLVDTTYKVHSTFPQPKPNLKKHNQGPIRANASKFLPPLSHSADKKIPKTVVENRTSSLNSRISAPLNLARQREAIQKLDPASLPDHCIFPIYKIVDNFLNTKHNKIRKKQTMQKHTKQESEWTAKSERTEVDVWPKYGTAPSRCLRLETMTLSKGVSNTSMSVESSQPTAQPQTPPVKLKPIRNEPAVFRFSVDQFVGDPQVTPLSQS